MKLAINSVTAQWLVPLLIALASLIGSGAVAYSKTNARLTALEANRENDKDKLDHIQTQVDKLVFWALGKK